MPPSEKQVKYATAAMNSSPKKPIIMPSTEEALQQNITALEKQLEWEKLWTETLDATNNIAQRKLKINTRTNLHN